MATAKSSSNHSLNNRVTSPVVSVQVNDSMLSSLLFLCLSQETDHRTENTDQLFASGCSERIEKMKKA